MFEFSDKQSSTFTLKSTALIAALAIESRDLTCSSAAAVNQFNDFKCQLTAQLARTNHRCLVLISGEEEWAIELLQQSLSALQCHWLGKGQWPSCIAMNNSKQLLGSEKSCLVFNAYSGFNPDAFGQSVGTLAGGGMCFLICPDLVQWPNFSDPDYQRYIASSEQLADVGNQFLQRATALINDDREVFVVEQGKPMPVINEQQFTSVNKDQSVGIYANSQQQETVQQILKTVSGHRRRPLVITADRGRGKSSALGIAAALLLQRKATNIVITAPNIRALASVFYHAKLVLGDAIIDKNQLSWQGKSLRFVAPDLLIEQRPICDLLLVDEAAAIPTPMLSAIAKHYSRVVFATTVHGYEGTGRGFALRFLKTLSEIAPQWRSNQLSQPIRWQTGDPLERFSNALLGLDAKAVELEAADLNRESPLTFEKITQQDLLAKPQFLQQLFGLLVLAHYQTSPSDFRQLLDAPQLNIFVALQDGQVVATALVLEEGQLDAQISEKVWLGERRLRGHLLPQSLCAQVGIKGACQPSYARIMRIAVHPTVQREGVGRQLDAVINLWAKQKNIDFVGASFGATSDLLRYWQQLNYQTVRIGITKDSASGTHSVLVLRAVSKDCQQIIAQASALMLAQLRYSLSGDLAQLDSAMVIALMKSMVQQETLSVIEHTNMTAYVATQRPFELLSHVIEKLLWSRPQRLSEMTPADQKLLVTKVLQQHAWPQVVKACDYNGKKQAQLALKQAIGHFIKE
ncbi:MAG: tRNA(Met) cytidine acetyltransferase [Psychrobium sp.]|nr:tRNA(Met) cytidine acetyltransferase [Psychrobium sp.]